VIVVIEHAEGKRIVAHHPQQPRRFVTAKRPPVRQRRDQLDGLLQFLEPSCIGRVPFKDVVTQYLSRPDTELGAPLGIYPVTDRDDGIEVVVFYLASYLPAPFVLNCCKKCSS